MLLDDRKRSILQAIIDDYINTAEPIGSRTIARKHELGLSSATIRNEMADLEELGFLAQPHTSAGRVPSDKGYRFYVDELMKSYQLKLEEIQEIKALMETKISELSQIIKQASFVISNLTKYTSMAITPEMKKVMLKSVQLVPIEPGKLLVVVVTNTDVVKNALVKICDNVSHELLTKIASILNAKLKGFTIEHITTPLIKEIEMLTGYRKEVLIPILNGVAECINQIDNSEIYLNGTTNILNYPEFKDICKVKEFLNLLDAKETLGNILNVCRNPNQVNIQIGNENKIDFFKECSIVTATYSIGDLVVGSIGVIGPTRMEYDRVITLMNYMRNKINDDINRYLGERLDDT